MLDLTAVGFFFIFSNNNSGLSGQAVINYVFVAQESGTTPQQKLTKRMQAKDVFSCVFV